MALSHVVDDKVEAAYRRGDLFEKRQAAHGLSGRGTCGTGPAGR